MSYEIERYSSGLDRQARREAERIRAAETVQRTTTDATENLAAYELSTRLVNGYQLVAQAQHHLTSLSQNTARTAQDNPGLQMQQQLLNDTYAFSAGQMVQEYMNRRKRHS